MWMFTDIANWWDKKRDQTYLMLDSYVEQNPNQFAVVVATAVHTSVSLGGSVVDLLRLGDGVQQGGWGYAEDGLRLLGVAGPVGKGLQLFKSAKNGKVAKLIADPAPGMGICGWVACTKAIAHVSRMPGAKLYAEVQDLVTDNLSLFLKSNGPLNMGK